MRVQPEFVTSQVNPQPETRPAGDLVPYSQQERQGLVRRGWAGPRRTVHSRYA